MHPAREVGPETHLQLPGEVRRVGLAVVVQGQAEVQAMVRVRSEAQLAVGMQQELPLAQAMLPGEREGLAGQPKPGVREGQGQ